MGPTVGSSLAAWPCGMTAARSSGWRARCPTSPRKEAECRERQEAFYDVLTGLPSRALVLDRIAQAVARKKRRQETLFGVFSLKIDDSKHRIDRPGRPMGDQLVIAISRRLEHCLREADSLARNGGADFIGFIDDVESADVILCLSTRILEVLRFPFSVNGQELAVSPSMGVALGGGPDLGAEQLVRNAEIAMYRGRSSGQSEVVVFD